MKNYHPNPAIALLKILLRLKLIFLVCKCNCTIVWEISNYFAFICFTSPNQFGQVVSQLATAQ